MTLPASSNYDFIELNAQGVGTTGPYVLAGGHYGITAIPGSGTITLALLGPDGSTKVSVVSTISSAGYQTAYLGPGSYYVTIATAAGSLAVQRVRGP